MQTLTSVKLKWKNPDFHGSLIGYIIEANNLNKKGALEWQPVAVLRNGRQSTYELSYTQLSPSSQYKFRIMAVNQAGVSEPANPNKIYGGSPIIHTPSHLELRARMPYYRESWFVILCACMSVIITIMVIAFLCVRNKTYKYKKDACKNSNGSHDRLSDLGFGLDDHLEPSNNVGLGSGTGGGPFPIEFEMRPTGTMTNTLTSQRNDRNRATLQRNRNATASTSMLNTANIVAQAKQPPRPTPGSFAYSDDDDEDDHDLKQGGAFYESSGNDSLTEKPSEFSSTGPDSESDDHDDLVAANQFVNHYANVNDTLRKGGISWKKQAKPYIVPTSSQQSLNKASTSSNSTYRPLPYPPTLPSTSAGPSHQHYTGSHFNLSSSQHPPSHSSHKSLLNQTSASTSSMNRVGFPNRQAPPPPPSYLSAINVSEDQCSSSEVDSSHMMPQNAPMTSSNPGLNSSRQAGPSTSTGSSNHLSGGRIIVNNMAGSRAPLPGFSSFV